MDFSLTEEQKMLKESIRKFAETEVAPLVNEAEQKEEFPQELFPGLGKLGYLAPRTPCRYGGEEMGKIADCIIVEELCRICAGIGSSLFAQSMIVMLIIDHGTEKLKQRYSVPAIKGDKIGAIALTEPNAGSDLAGIETKAVKDRNYYVVNGSKMFITNAKFADFTVLLAYTDKNKGAGKGMSLFIVDKGTPGYIVSRKLSKMSNRSSETYELAFQDCKISSDKLIGEEGSGFGYLMETLGNGRISHCFRSLGIAQAAFEAAVKYAQERVQFGRPIGKFQAISFKLARMDVLLEAGHWLGYHAAWLLDQGEDCLREASIAKLFASEAALYCSGEAVHIHGGYGVTTDLPVERYFRDARMTTISEGTSEIQQTIIARQLKL